MNRTERDNIVEICQEIRNCLDRLREIGDAEQEKFDNLPENLQSSDKGEQFETNASTISDCCDSIEDELSNIEDL